MKSGLENATRLKESIASRRNMISRDATEHLFRVIKCQFGYTKVRYQGLTKNAAQVFMLVGLANLYLKRRALLA